MISDAAAASRTPVTCPWCEGSGRFERGHDAQAAAREGHAPDA